VEHGKGDNVCIQNGALGKKCISFPHFITKETISNFITFSIYSNGLHCTSAHFLLEDPDQMAMSHCTQVQLGDKGINHPKDLKIFKAEGFI
jgi:hypothetical protein